jgi:hypothetical protein
MSRKNGQIIARGDSHGSFAFTSGAIAKLASALSTIEQSMALYDTNKRT